MTNSDYDDDDWDFEDDDDDWDFDNDDEENGTDNEEDDDDDDYDSWDDSEDDWDDSDDDADTADSSDDDALVDEHDETDDYDDYDDYDYDDWDESTDDAGEDHKPQASTSQNTRISDPVHQRQTQDAAEALKTRILARAKDAWPKKHGIGDDIGLLFRRGADEAANMIASALGASGDDLNYTYFDYRRDYLDKQLKVLEAAWAMFTEHKDNLRSRDKTEIYEYLVSVRSQIRKLLHNLEAHRRNAEWRARQEANLARWEETLERLEDRLQRLLDNIATNESRLEDAWSDEYIERIRGWIESDEAQVEELRDRIYELEKKIKSVRAELDRDKHSYHEWEEEE